MSYAFSQRNEKKVKKNLKWKDIERREGKNDVSGHKRFPREYVFSSAQKMKKNILNRKRVSESPSESHDHLANVLNVWDIQCDISVNVANITVVM